MPYIICNNNNYLVQNENGALIINDKTKASIWKDKNKADNVLRHLKKKFNNYHLSVKFICTENVERKLDYDILEKISELSKFTKEIEERKQVLLHQLSEVDLEITDIEHAAEFYNLNASQGYKLYKMLHDARIKRREVKDELQKINWALNSHLNNKSITALESNINKLDNRVYVPRIHHELFEI